MLSKKMIDLLEEKNALVDESNDNLCVQYYSPLGEDFIVYDDVPLSDQLFANHLKELAETFDPDEHARMWISSKSRGKPRSALAIAKDALLIASYLEDLSFCVVRFASKQRELETAS